MIIGNVFRKKEIVSQPLNGRIQCFLQDVLQEIKPRLLKQHEIDPVIQKLRKIFCNNPYILHGSYCVVFRSGNSFGTKLFYQDINIAYRSQAKCYIAHFSKHDSYDELASMINHLPKQVRDILVIEIDASKVETPQKYIDTIINIKQQLGVKLCLDVAHLFSSGICNEYDDFRKFLNKYLQYFDVLHLNDQVHQFGTGMDQHCAPLLGRLFGKLKLQHAADILLQCITHFDIIVLEFADPNNVILNTIQQYKQNKLLLDSIQLANLLEIVRTYQIKCIDEEESQQQMYRYNVYDNMATFITNWMNAYNKPFSIKQQKAIYGFSDKFQKLCFISLFPEITSHNDMLLNDQQKIKRHLLNIWKTSHTDSSPNISVERYTKKQIDFIYKSLLKILGIGDDIATICGSYRRRQKREISDIDLVIDAQYQQQIQQIIKDNPLFVIKSWGKVSHINFYYQDENAINVDIAFASGAEYPYALLYLTGNRHFTIALRQFSRKLGYKLANFDMVDQQNNKIKVKSEEDIFKILGLSYIEPQYRIYNNIQHMCKARSS